MQNDEQPLEDTKAANSQAAMTEDDWERPAKELVVVTRNGREHAVDRYEILSATRRAFLKSPGFDVLSFTRMGLAIIDDGIRIRPRSSPAASAAPPPIAAAGKQVRLPSGEMAGVGAITAFGTHLFRIMQIDPLRTAVWDGQRSLWKLDLEGLPLLRNERLATPAEITAAGIDPKDVPESQQGNRVVTITREMMAAGHAACDAAAFVASAHTPCEGVTRWTWMSNAARVTACKIDGEWSDNSLERASVVVPANDDDHLVPGRIARYEELRDRVRAERLATNRQALLDSCAPSPAPVEAKNDERSDLGLKLEERLGNLGEFLSIIRTAESLIGQQVELTRKPTWSHHKNEVHTFTISGVGQCLHGQFLNASQAAIEWCEIVSIRPLLTLAPPSASTSTQPPERSTTVGAGERELNGVEGDERKYVPWTFETMPVAVKVRSTKYRLQAGIVMPYSNECVVIHNFKDDVNYTYDDLFRDFTQLDGTPCGALV